MKKPAKRNAAPVPGGPLSPFRGCANHRGQYEKTDGTVDCKHKKGGEMIAEAGQAVRYLIDLVFRVWQYLYVKRGPRFNHFPAKSYVRSPKQRANIIQRPSTFRSFYSGAAQPDGCGAKS